MKTRLDWEDIHRLGRCDKGNRWFPRHEYWKDLEGYLWAYRSPSRNWPWSYAKALMTYKAAEWILENRPGIAKMLGLEYREGRETV